MIFHLYYFPYLIFIYFLYLISYLIRSLFTFYDGLWVFGKSWLYTFQDLLSGRSLISYLEKLGLWRSELGAKNCTIDRTTKGYIKGRESGISFL